MPNLDFTSIEDKLFERNADRELASQQRRIDLDKQIQAAADGLMQTGAFARQDRGSYVTYVLMTLDSDRAAILQRNRQTGQVSCLWNETTHSDVAVIRALEISRETGKGRAN